MPKCKTTIIYTLIFELQGRYTKNNEISWLGHNEWLEICTIFFRDRVKGMMSNASCFIILFHVNK
jgi:hypothetical protein